MRGESAPTTVGIQELRAQLGRYVDQVKAGGTVTITEGGKPVGRIVPVKPSLEDKEQKLIDSGLLAWSGRKLSPRSPSITPRGDRTVSELLLEDRD
jgi:prevent-host-death family protein